MHFSTSAEIIPESDRPSPVPGEAVGKAIEHCDQVMVGCVHCVRDGALHSEALHNSEACRQAKARVYGKQQESVKVAC